jgi:gliding motility-associated-like protein
MRFWLVIAFVLIGFAGFSTHNRSGYISYCYNSSTGNYDFRIHTYTNPKSHDADRCEQTLYICDIHGNLSDSLVCPRINNDGITFPSGYCVSGCTICGDLIVPPNGSYDGVKANVYAGSMHLNPALYTITLIDPNRDFGINNINNSSTVAFALIDTICAYAGILGIGTNCTPTITNPPIQNACVGTPWCYNPGANDPEHDSLDYSITKSFMDDPDKKPQGVLPIGFETFPGGLTIDRLTGTLCWNSPTTQGEWNFAMFIKEYRRNIYDGKMYLVSVTLFDIQVLVNPCPPNNITFQNPPKDTCVVAGTNFTSSFSVTATGITPPLTLTGSGLPFNFTTNAATLTSTSSGGSTASGTLNWTPSCSVVQASPYQITLQAHDGGSPYNANFSTFNIHVVSPSPINLTAVSVSDSIRLTWNPPPGCGTTTGNTIQHYLIYRISGCPGFATTPCQTGLPSGTGYTLVGVTTNTATTFMDNNYLSGFPPGNTYSYIIVAEFGDGAFSLASTNVCVTMKLVVPLLMKVSVDTTDASAGKIKVWWHKPLASPLNFDTVKHHGPYKHILYRRGAFKGNPPLYNYTGHSIYTYTVANYGMDGQLNNKIDTFTDVNLATRDTQYYYTVAFYDTDSTGNFRYLGSASQGNSIYLKATPHDKKVILNWAVHVPWTNQKYYILQQGFGGASDNYTVVDSTTALTYTVKKLTNGHTYCFKILSRGAYGSVSLQNDTIWNYSEKICAAPVDDEPPCQPSLFIAGNCNSSFNKLTWTNPNHTCNINDVVKYVIYYAAFQDSILHPVDSVSNPMDTTFTTDFSNSIAGCYVIVAVDSVGNRSPLANQICTDNCPEYELPNVFTPNGDNINDQYIPVKNKYIKDVDFTMYNRWGGVVFETADPALKWDGKSSQMKQPVSDGTYFYICKYREIHYYGYVEKTLKGFVQVLH